MRARGWLRKINPDLASYEQGAINNARNICGDLRDGVNPPRVSQRYDKVPLTSSKETQDRRTDPDDVLPLVT